MKKENSDFICHQDSRILTLSHRQLDTHVASCCLYEFEDIIFDLDAVDVFTPVNSYNYSKKIYTWLKRATRSSLFANYIKPDPNPCSLDRDYELFNVILAKPWQVLSLNSLKGWRKKSKKAICYLIEIWDKDFEGFKPLLKLLKDFEHIFVGVAGSTEKIAKFTGIPCTYLPPGIDTVKFYPYPFSSDRYIDVSYIGRRSPVTHQALLSLAQQGKIHYLYDTARNLNIIDPKEHRSLLANLTKRSRYFIANRPMIDKPNIRGNQSEIGYRFFEGAAAGTVMIGDYPDTKMFNQYFDWSDAVIRIPFDAPNIADIIADLDAQPFRLSRIRRDNVVNSLLKHDWVYRWKTILETVDLPVTSKMLSRENYLKDLAQMASGKGLERTPSNDLYINNISSFTL
ncbi:MAG: glycosyltransferase family 1 protein [Moorea sp. SIO2B7]|nr:glycosyltransferase family 1 protein [Moorena sp. SIO2B7]